MRSDPAGGVADGTDGPDAWATMAATINALDASDMQPLRWFEVSILAD
jgi:hypothetical protein